MLCLYLFSVVVEWSSVYFVLPSVSVSILPIFIVCLESERHYLISFKHRINTLLATNRQYALFLSIPLYPSVAYSWFFFLKTTPPPPLPSSQECKQFCSSILQFIVVMFMLISIDLFCFFCGPLPQEFTWLSFSTAHCHAEDENMKIDIFFLSLFSCLDMHFSGFIKYCTVKSLMEMIFCNIEALCVTRVTLFKQTYIF